LVILPDNIHKQHSRQHLPINALPFLFLPSWLFYKPMPRKIKSNHLTTLVFCAMSCPPITIFNKVW
jgi:hypothetical protein